MLLLHLSLYASHSSVLSLSLHCHNNQMYTVMIRTKWMIELKSSQQTTHTHTHNLQLRCSTTSCFLVYFFLQFFPFQIGLNQNNLMFNTAATTTKTKKSDIKTAKKTVKIAFTLDVICKVLIWKIFQNKNQLNHHFQSFQAPITVGDFNLQPILCSKFNQIVCLSSYLKNLQSHFVCNDAFGNWNVCNSFIISTNKLQFTRKRLFS